MPNRRFSNETGKKIDKLYIEVVKPMSGRNSRGGCMAAVYNGTLAALYGETFANKLWKAVYRKSVKLDKARKKPSGTHNSVDLIMSLLQSHGLTEDPWVFRYKKKKFQCIVPKDYAGKGVEEAINENLKNAKEGWYFFGASVSGGYHSVVLGIKKSAAGIKIYWLDQFSKGLENRRNNYATSKTEVTGKLDKALRKVGKNRVKLWPLLVPISLRDMAKGLSWMAPQRIDLYEPSVYALQGSNGLMTRRLGHRGGVGVGRRPLG